MDANVHVMRREELAENGVVCFVHAGKRYLVAGIEGACA
jgi:hypothetical protein